MTKTKHYATGKDLVAPRHRRKGQKARFRHRTKMNLYKFLCPTCSIALSYSFVPSMKSSGRRWTIARTDVVTNYRTTRRVSQRSTECTGIPASVDEKNVLQTWTISDHTISHIHQPGMWCEQIRRRFRHVVCKAFFDKVRRWPFRGKLLSQDHNPSEKKKGMLLSWKLVIRHLR